jgi:hypothetical protein
VDIFINDSGDFQESSSLNKALAGAIKKNKLNVIYIDPENIDLEYFTNIIYKHFKIGVTYSLLYKAMYDGNNFKMVEVNKV